MLPQDGNVNKHKMHGDKKNFEKLFFDLFPKLIHFSYVFVKDKEIARDIANESFLKLWELRFQLSEDTNPEAFLITVCRNKCLNFLKHKKVILRYQEKTSVDTAELEIFSGILDTNGYADFDYNVLKDKVNNAIQHLPEQCRRVFELSRFKKKKYTDISATLNISVKTVEAHISLALKRLKEELKDFL